MKKTMVPARTSSTSKAMSGDTKPSMVTAPNKKLVQKKKTK